MCVSMQVFITSRSSCSVLNSTNKARNKLVCDIRNTHIQEHLRDNTACFHFPVQLQSSFVFFMSCTLHLVIFTPLICHTWKATHMAYILAAVQVKEGERAQMESSVVSP